MSIVLTYPDQTKCLKPDNNRVYGDRSLIWEGPATDPSVIYIHYKLDLRDKINLKLSFFCFYLAVYLNQTAMITHDKKDPSRRYAQRGIRNGETQKTKAWASRDITASGEFTKNYLGYEYLIVQMHKIYDPLFLPLNP